MGPLGVIAIIIGIIVLIFVLTGIKLVRQSTSVVIERLGKYYRTLDTGLHIVVPFIDRQNGTAIDLKEQIADFQPQPVITKDNVTMQIDTVVYYQITDPKLYRYGVNRPISAIENLTATTLRNIVGDLELDETLTSRETVNAKMRVILDEATDPWGIKVNRVELKNILPPKDIRDAMEKQMRAERERREAILRAEGEKRSNILVTEGEKEAQIMRAEAKRIAVVAEAEGEKEAAILRAEAKRVALIKEAEGTAEAIKKIIEAKPDAAYVTLQGYEALKVLADGQSTKIIIPSELQNVAGLLSAVTETIKNAPDASKNAPVKKTAEK